MLRKRCLFLCCVLGLVSVWFSKNCGKIFQETCLSNYLILALDKNGSFLGGRKGAFFIVLCTCLFSEFLFDAPRKWVGMLNEIVVYIG